jgi:imidazolonepropionase-like amidohydrolase
MRRIVLALCVVALCVGSGCGGCDGDDHQVTPDAMADAPPAAVVCEVLPATTSGNTCDITAGGTTMLIKGNVLTPDTVYTGGQVAVDDTGHITCVGCDCAAGGETVVTCPDGVVSPGLINTHDHITYTENLPYVNSNNERWDDRQQWRKGGNGHTKINAPGSATASQVQWGELRFLMGGATSIVGSGGQKGLLRNLDQAANMEGLQKKAVDFDTFPLDDSGGTQRTTDCNYGGTATGPSSLDAIDSYEPHTSEGIDAFAHNEFLCESSATYDTAAPGVSNDIAISKTSMIHGIGLFAQDYSLMATNGVGLIWSPRSNISLYGDTARVTIASKLGVNIALGTDWMPSGSMNLLRELKCADTFNTKYLASYFNDKQMWAMVTSNAAAVTKMDDQIGVLAPGHIADISIFAGHGKDYRAVIEAQPADVALVMRAGKTLYGDDALVGALATQCDQVDVCNSMKQVCLTTEVGKNYSALMSAAGAVYPAFVCDVPMNEPTCDPSRPVSVGGSTVYTGVSSATDSDGDGIPDDMDKCPHVFDPIRPMDMGAQADTDGDGLGDACDPCPLDANTTTCTTVDPNDRDHDGIDNATDNCADVANPDQADADHDAKGDLCDACPNQANPGAAGCPASIYAIKNGMVPTGTAVEVTHALVTGSGTNGFFAQVRSTDAGFMGSDYSGIFVFTGTASPFLTSATVGARVTIDGSIDVFGGEIELDALTNLTVESVGPDDPPVPVTGVTYSEVMTGGTRQAKLEGVVITLPAATVTAVDTSFGEATLTAADSTTLIMDDTLYAANATIGQNYLTVTGVLSTKPITAGSASKLQPRSPADLVPGAPGLASFGPALSYAKVGTTNNAPTYPQALTVTLTGNAIDDTNVMIMSGTTAALTVGNVVVPAGMSSVTVPVTAVAQNADVTLTAMLGTNMQTAHVRVLGAGEVPQTVMLSPNDATVNVNGTVQFTVTLDVPAVTSTQIGLAVTNGAGTLPATVQIDPPNVSTTFTYTDVAISGTATVTATFGASTSSANVTVSTGANHLVINEIDYDNVGIDTAEYVEIYNPSGAAISLANKTLNLVNGSNSETYVTIDLSPAVSLASHQYLVLANAAVTVPMTALKIDTGWHNAVGDVQNGPPDGAALVDTSTNTVIDAISYEGSITAAMLPGFIASLVEGTALASTVADSNTTEGSLCRHPDGQDTDNAAADWGLCATLSPGTANP